MITMKQVYCIVSVTYENRVEYVARDVTYQANGKTYIPMVDKRYDAFRFKSMKLAKKAIRDVEFDGGITKIIAIKKKKYKGRYWTFGYDN